MSLCLSADELRELTGKTRPAAQERVLPLDQLRGLPSGEPPWESGVYFLWRGPRLLYVGRATYLGDRLASHVRCRDGVRPGKAIPFQRHTYIEMPAFVNDVLDPRKHAAVDRIEAQYIRTYRPPYNDKIP